MREKKWCGYENAEEEERDKRMEWPMRKLNVNHNEHGWMHRRM